MKPAAPPSPAAIRMTSVNWSIGGTSLFGGYGSTLGTVIRAFIPATLQNGF